MWLKTLKMHDGSSMLAAHTKAYRLGHELTIPLKVECAPPVLCVETTVILKET